MTAHSTILIDATPALEVCRWALRQGTPKDIGEAACSALAQSPEWTDRLLASEHRNSFWSQPDMAHALTVSEATEFAGRDAADRGLLWVWPILSVCCLASVTLAIIGAVTVFQWAFL